MRRIVLPLAAPLALLVAPLLAADAESKAVMGGLDNPSGVAVQPGTGDVFVSDSGAGRIVRLTGGKVENVIVHFPQDIYGKGPMYNIGPLGLAFLNEETLVVGGGGLPDGEEMLRVYKVPAAGEKPINADKMVASFTLAAENPGADDELKGEGNFYAVVAAKDAVYVTSNGDDTKGWVARGAVADGKVTGFERFLATKEAVHVDAPVGITMDEEGRLVVGQMGEITVPNDSLLSFYSADGELKENYETGLFDITGVAYSPKTGNLFATDFAWMDTAEGGLFQLIAKREGGEQTVEAKKIAGLDKPTALAFGPDGALYVTVIGTSEEGSEKKPGKLLRIEPGL